LLQIQDSQSRGDDEMNGEREIRLSIQEVDAILKKANLVSSKEVVSEIRIEPGELIIKAVR